MLFLNRRLELDFLEESWRSERAGLQIVYGRRRVGKTELLRKFADGKRQIFYVATQSSLEGQLRTFSAALQQGLGPECQGVGFSSWADALTFLAGRCSVETLVVLDEFPYLVESDPSLPSVLQAFWDSHLRHTRLQLVLCGSSISFMESEVLGQRSPLYGRRTGQFLVEPLEHSAAGLFFPSASADEMVELYATLGGMPAYLLQFDQRRDLWENIERKILRKGSFLHDEVSFLLMQELREPRIYLAILTAIAEGHTRLNEIAQRALGPSQLNRASYYLQTLQNLHLLERIVPVTERAPHKSRKGIYRIRDPFVRFWMRFVYTEASSLEIGDVEPVMERIRQSWSDFVAPVFEDLCRWSTRSGHLRPRLPFRPWKVGSWWGPGGEVDVVAIDRDGRKLLLGECKWSQRQVGLDVLERLQQKGKLLQDELGHGPLEVHYALFSRSGFTPALSNRPHELLLLTPEDLYATAT